MKFTQIRTKENIHFGADLGKSIVAGSGTSGRAGLELESYEDIGVKITYKGQILITPWSNIIGAYGSEVPAQPKPVAGHVG